MKRTNRFFTLLGILLFLALCFVPNARGQSNSLSFIAAPAQIAQSYTFTANSSATPGFNVNGLRYWQILFVPSGTVSACSISLDSSVGSGYTSGGIVAAATIGSCASAGAYSNSSPTTPTLLGQITPSITGTGSVTVVLLGYVNNPGAAGSSSASITNPVDVSGYVEVNCKTGCSGGNPNGQATMANSAPVVVASNQSAIPVTESAALPSGTNTIGAVNQGTAAAASGAWPAKVTDGTNVQAVKAASTAAGATDPSAVVALSPNSPLPAGTNNVGTVDVKDSSGNSLLFDPCSQLAHSQAVINLTASGQLITGTASKQTYICFLQFAISSTADNVALVEGTGSTCGTSTAGMAGGSTAATGWNLLANGSVTGGSLDRWSFKTATQADNVCLLASSGAQISGVVNYVQQ